MRKSTRIKHAAKSRTVWLVMAIAAMNGIVESSPELKELVLATFGPHGVGWLNVILAVCAAVARVFPKALL